MNTIQLQNDVTYYQGMRFSEYKLGPVHNMYHFYDDICVIKIARCGVFFIITVNDKSS